MGSQPTASSSWYELAKFSNWKTTGNVYSGACQFNGSGTLTNIMTRAQIAADGGLFYVLPTEDECTKPPISNPMAVPTRSIPPAIRFQRLEPAEKTITNAIGSVWNVGTGIAENNGTSDINGNVLEWNESAFDGSLDNMAENRVIRGGSEFYTENSLRSSNRSNNSRWIGHDSFGFRVDAIPEPSTIAFVDIFGGGLILIRRYFPSV